jgi:hypothetical protein
MKNAHCHARTANAARLISYASRCCHSAFLLCCHILIVFSFVVRRCPPLALLCPLRAMDRCISNDLGRLSRESTRQRAGSPSCCQKRSAVASRNPNCCAMYASAALVSARRPGGARRGGAVVVTAISRSGPRSLRPSGLMSMYSSGWTDARARPGSALVGQRSGEQVPRPGRIPASQAEHLSGAIGSEPRVARHWVVAGACLPGNPSHFGMGWSAALRQSVSGREGQCVTTAPPGLAGAAVRAASR